MRRHYTARAIIEELREDALTLRRLNGVLYMDWDAAVRRAEKAEARARMEAEPVRQLAEEVNGLRVQLAIARERAEKAEAEVARLSRESASEFVAWLTKGSSRVRLEGRWVLNHFSDGPGEGPVYIGMKHALGSFLSRPYAEEPSTQPAGGETK